MREVSPDSAYLASCSKCAECTQFRADRDRLRAEAAALQTGELQTARHQAAEALANDAALVGTATHAQAQAGAAGGSIRSASQTLAEAQARLRKTDATWQGTVDEVASRINVLLRQACDADNAWRQCCFNSHQARRRRMWRALGAVLLLVAVVLGVVLIVRHHSVPTSASGPGATAVTSADVSRVETATTDALASTETLRTGFAALSGVPTKPQITNLVNPYVSALQLYGTVLTGTPVPRSAAAVDRHVQATVSENVTYLQRINTDPGVDIGTFLRGVLVRDGQFQQSAGSLAHALRTGPGS